MWGHNSKVQNSAFQNSGLENSGFQNSYFQKSVLQNSEGLLCISIRIESAFERLSIYNASRTKSYNFSADRFINTI